MLYAIMLTMLVLTLHVFAVMYRPYNLPPNTFKAEKEAAKYVEDIDDELVKFKEENSRSTAGVAKGANGVPVGTKKSD